MGMHDFGVEPMTMVDQHLADHKAVADHPSELRALIDFLQPDTRPTVIFCDSHDGRQEIVYGNPAFEEWQRQLDDRVHLPQNGDESHLPKSEEALRRDGWEVRRSGEYHILVATASHESVTGVHRAKENDAPNGTNGNIPNGGPVGRTSMDWTSSPVPNMSPWIQFMRAFDWASTGVGPMESWSPVLRHHMLSIMANPNPRTIIWGDDMTFIYNEACAQLFGSKHPEFMGVKAPVAWASVWNEAGPLIDGAYAGRATSVKDLYLVLHRSGFLEETYWNITSLPILSPEGSSVGALSELLETTLLVTGDRRRNALKELNESASKAAVLQELWPAVTEGLQASGVDLPFALLYAVADDVLEDADGSSDDSSTLKKCVLASTTGLAHDHIDAIKAFKLAEQDKDVPSLVETIRRVYTTRKMVEISPENGTLPLGMASAVPERSFGDPIRQALVSPISAAGSGDVLAIIVFALNPRCSLNAEYNLFIQIALDFIEKAAALISLPEEQRRARKIADDINHALAQQLRMTTLEAQRSQARFSRLADIAPTGMYMFDSDGKMLYCNDAYLALFGQTQEEAAIKRFTPDDWTSFVHENDLELFLGKWTVVTEQKIPVTVEYRLNRPYKSVDKVTGREIVGETWMAANAFPEIEPDGKVASVQGWLTDISHRKFTERLLAQQLEDALENKRQSENFIDMTSHEMRNPLSAILQSADSIVSTISPAALPVLDDADVILSREVAEEVIDAAQTIILCAQHQKRIVDDILTLSKLDASLLVICPDKVHLPSLVAKALKMYEAEIARADVDAQICIEPSCDELAVDWVVLDPSRLLQVIINLLTNAIKFTQDSPQRQITICLGASREPPTGKHHGISFISPRNNARSPHAPHSEWGTGEDIYIQVAVIDTGRGLSPEEMKSLFQRFQQASPKTYKQYGGSGLGLFISRELCELQGGQIGAASGNGKTTFTFFVKAKRCLPDAEQPAPAKPILPRFSTAPAGTLALKTRKQQLIKEATHGLGLIQIENASLSATDAQTTAPLLRSRTESSELHILIVEDNLINQKVMSQQLRKAGCTVHVANHGVECLNFLEMTAFCSAPIPLSVILLDLEMPTMDGLTCIRHIRERQASGAIIGHVPVIAVTANARSEQIALAIEAGMDQVVTKPFRIPELVPQMRSLVARLAELQVTIV